MPLIPYHIAPARLEEIALRYGGTNPPRLGYGTVRDYCDSVEHLPELATVNRDLKDPQRAWMLKAILGRVPRGGTVLEIGAGDPHVAHWLSLLGYQVWIVDPYDGSGNGPIDFAFYQEHFPTLRFVRRVFADTMAELPAAGFDCIYSISVLEHVPHPALASVLAGIHKFSRKNAPTIHAVDHVLQGHGDRYHLDTLHILAAGLGLPAGELSAVISAATSDTETYFLSAESHNMWRGATPYDEFPMRRCISVQFCQPV
jgi:hypothetical protein